MLSAEPTGYPYAMKKTNTANRINAIPQRKSSFSRCLRIEWGAFICANDIPADWLRKSGPFPKERPALSKAYPLY